jgi:hypothetical protein
MNNAAGERSEPAASEAGAGCSKRSLGALAYDPFDQGHEENKGDGERQDLRGV